MNANALAYDLAHEWLVHSRAVPAASALVERAYFELQRLAALVLFVVVSPLMLTTAFLMWAQHGRPILFGHYRVGRNGCLFKCWKFRTMVPDAERVLAELLKSDPAARDEWARDQKLRNDPRVTKIGAWLRYTSLDELPQLINVMRGEMALVGPRPVTVRELARYGDCKRHYMFVRPGITGLWQVSGRNDVTYEKRVQLDRAYVESRSLSGDLAILLRTVRVVLKREGAH